MRDALGKGYIQEEICQQIAEVEIIISATALKDFLAREQKDAGQELEEKAAISTEKNGQRHDGKSASNSEKFGRKQREDLAEKELPGSGLYVLTFNPLQIF